MQLVSGNAGLLAESPMRNLEQLDIWFNCPDKKDTLYHFIYECELYKDARETHINSFLGQIKLEDLLSKPMTSDERTALSVCVCKALAIRKQYSLKITQENSNSFTLNVSFTDSKVK